VQRPAPSGGALYPIETYLATSAGPGRAAAVHHDDTAHHRLDHLRTSDHRATLISLLAASPPTLPDLVLALTAVFWRNGVKYDDFAYRLQCQETGGLTAQALALAAPLNLTTTVHLNFADQHTQSLLGLNPTRPRRHRVAAPPQRPTHRHNPRPQRHTRPTHHHTSTTTAAPGHNSAPAAGPPHPPCRRNHLPGFRPHRLPAHRSGPPAAGHRTGLCATTGYPGDLPSTLRTPLSVTPYCVLVHRVTGITPGAYHY
jgi:SagB-type dehydrogenase family enzyme